ncbi:MAG: hypothetical protein P0Y55_11865 [Candidatus Cohnella colombiensis]|uniref:DUF5405 domain-containing protein n=1 Tax=Candidatus Cohnella colombiensis TaxID=3121368 RepID=A0AA95EXT2_9BACL|nr:MAG: hypothetical protein P0Y55_11865 [Cohnella sp.]
MKVQIEGNLYLESDSFQFILKEYGVVKEGKNAGEETVSTIAYLTSIEHAFRYLLKQKIKESTATNVRELIADLRRIEKWLHDLLDDEQPRGEGPR